MSQSPCKYEFMRHWITGEGYHASYEPRPVILECIPSRTGLSMTVYDRGERLYAINGCGFDRLGCALAEFLETLFQPELGQLGVEGFQGSHHVACASFTAINMAAPWEATNIRVSLNGCCGFESMVQVANAIGLKVHQSQSKAGTLIIIEKGV